MNNSACQIVCLGEVSPWAKHFLNGLRSNAQVELVFEPAWESFKGARDFFNAQILFIENFPESRQLIQKIRALGCPFYTIWYGRLFTKDDFPFAITHRIFSVIENQRHDDNSVLSLLEGVATRLDQLKQQFLLLRSIKAILLQAEGDIAPPLMTELRTAFSKLEAITQNNEMLGGTPKREGENSKVLFHKSEALSDALETIHNLERTGVLWIKQDQNEEGRIDFLQGKIIGATAGEVKSFKAIYRMFLWDDPRFIFTRREAEECAVEEYINVVMKSVCDEGEGLRRRYHGLRRDIPPIDLMLELNPNSLHIGLNLPCDDFEVLANVVEYHSIRRILDYNPLSDVAVYEALIRLKRANMIRIAA